MQRTSLVALVAISLVTTAHAQGALGAPCFVQNLGTALGLSDDQVAPSNALGFAFPLPGGGSITSIDISSNGFVWLGSNSNPACCSGDVPSFLTDTARIALMWTDLYPPSYGDVWFNTFPAVGSTPASAVITWNDVPEIGTNTVQTMQLQMFSDGSFSMAFDPRCANTFHDALIGVTQGISATTNPIDFSAISTFYDSGTNPTVLELMQNTWDLAGRSFAFVPNGNGGYLVFDRPGCVFASVQSFGLGCPQAAAVYEVFTATSLVDLSNTSIDFFPNGSGGYVTIPGTGFYNGYTGTQSFFDDDVQGPFNLGFTFPYAGGASTNAIDIASNGFIWLQSGLSFDSRCCNGNSAAFLADAASIAGYWIDLNPSAGGNMYFDAVGGTEAHITWVNVPEYFNQGSNTFQITLRNDGSFRLAFGSVANISHDALVGMSQGNVLVDPGSVDLSSGVITTPSGGVPLLLKAQANSAPLIGTTFTMDVDQITPSSLLGLMVFGLTSFAPPGIDLTPIGMPGCSLHVSLDVLLSFPLAGNPTPFALAIPNTPSLAGAVLFAQAATLTPAINPLQIVSSNGLGITVGN